jgi:hypothetical protein
MFQEPNIIYTYVDLIVIVLIIFAAIRLVWLLIKHPHCGYQFVGRVVIVSLCVLIMALMAKALQRWVYHDPANIADLLRDAAILVIGVVDGQLGAKYLINKDDSDAT